MSIEMGRPLFLDMPQHPSEEFDSGSAVLQANESLSEVHSTNSTSPTSLGCTHRHSFILFQVWSGPFRAARPRPYLNAGKWESSLSTDRGDRIAAGTVLV